MQSRSRKENPQTPGAMIDRSNRLHLLDGRYRGHAGCESIPWYVRGAGSPVLVLFTGGTYPADLGYPLSACCAGRFLRPLGMEFPVKFPQMTLDTPHRPLCAEFVAYVSRTTPIPEPIHGFRTASPELDTTGKFSQSKGLWVARSSCEWC